MKALTSLTVLLLAASLHGAEPPKPRNGEKLIVLNDDGFSPFYFGAYKTAENLRKRVLGLRDTQVAVFEWCVISGSRANYPSKVTELIGDGVKEYGQRGDQLAAETFHRLAREGTDTLQVVAGACHEAGIACYASLRMNGDYSASWMGETTPRLFNSRFWWDHPAFRIRGQKGHEYSQLSYAYPEVRKFKLDILREVAARDITGINLDFLRHPPFFGYDEPLLKAFEEKHHTDPRAVPPEDPRWHPLRAQFMTAFVRDVRKLLDDEGGRKHRHLGLSARVDWREYKAWGCDIETWLKEGLLDYLVLAQHTLGGYEFDITPFVKMARGTGCAVLFGEEGITSGHDPTPQEDKLVAAGKMKQLPSRGSLTLEQYQTRAARWYAAGADGVHLFNGPGNKVVLSVLGTVKAAGPLSSGGKSVPRLIYNDDASNFLMSGDDLTVKDLRTYLSRFRGTQVDLVAYCVALGGYVTYYESAIADPIGTGFPTWDKVRTRRLAHNRERLRDEAGDYIGAVFSILREMKLPVVASIRMNDAHMSSDPRGPLAGQFWKKHPQWRLGAPYGYYASCLDYTVPEVRDCLRQLVREIISTFPDIAGIELDGMRSPYFFKPDEGRKNAPLMTELIRQIHGDLDAAAREKGRDHYLLRVNVPRTPELALECGMDVAAWNREDLVDGISPGCYNTDFQPAVDAWRKLPGNRLPIHAYVNCGPGTAMYHSLEQYRGAAANAYGAGADGVYLFNFPCFDELSRLLPRPVNQSAFPPVEFHAQGWHPDLVQTRQALHELGDAGGLAHKDKHYLFYTGSLSSYRHYTQDVAFIDRATLKPATLSFRCFEGTDTKEITLKLKTAGVTTRERFSFALNGKPIAGDRIQRLHAPDGRDARIHSVPLQPYSQFVFNLSRDILRRGENQLIVSLDEKEPDVTGKIDLVEMELLLHY